MIFDASEITRPWAPWTAADVRQAATEGWGLDVGRADDRLMIECDGDVEATRARVAEAAKAGSELHIRALLFVGAVKGSEHTLTCSCPGCAATEIQSNDTVLSLQPVLEWEVQPSDGELVLSGTDFASGRVVYETTEPLPGEAYACRECDETFERPFIEGVDAQGDRGRIREWNQAYRERAQIVAKLPDEARRILTDVAAWKTKYPAVCALLDPVDLEVMERARFLVAEARDVATRRFVGTGDTETATTATGLPPGPR